MESYTAKFWDPVTITLKNKSHLRGRKKGTGSTVVDGNLTVLTNLSLYNSTAHKCQVCICLRQQWVLSPNVRFPIPPCTILSFIYRCDRPSPSYSTKSVCAQTNPNKYLLLRWNDRNNFFGLCLQNIIKVQGFKWFIFVMQIKVLKSDFLFPHLCHICLSQSRSSLFQMHFNSYIRLLEAYWEQHDFLGPNALSQKL